MWHHDPSAAVLQHVDFNLQETQGQALPSDKLASIGQVAAGVAHEINHQIGYVLSNFGTLEGYVRNLFEMLAAYESAEGAGWSAESMAKLAAMRERIDLDYLKADIPALLKESGQGISRVRTIVGDLKDVSHPDRNQEWVWTDVHAGIDSTLNLVNNEIKYKADVVKEYGKLPEIQCLPMQLDQVIMNLLLNAAHAVDKQRGRIAIRSGAEGDHVWVEVADDGCGMTPEVQSRVFDPFFTTKPIGKGTGLGLSLAYGIIQKHQGRIDLHSEVGKGTTFRVWLPIRHDDVRESTPAQAAPVERSLAVLEASGACRPNFTGAFCDAAQMVGHPMQPTATRRRPESPGELPGAVR